jgi:transposase
MKPEVAMQRRKFSREFKLEAVKLVRERGGSAAQAARDLDVHENLLRKWIKEFGSDPVQAFPGHGQMKPEQQTIENLQREVTKLKAERAIRYEWKNFIVHRAHQAFGIENLVDIRHPLGTTDFSALLPRIQALKPTVGLHLQLLSLHQAP